jgi:hypothetical protein
VLFALLTVANAAEVEWSGHYRTRGLAYRNLSLSATNPNAIGSTAYADHRLRLQPAFHLSSRVSVHTQLDFLPYTPWGVTTDAWVDPVTGQSIDLAYADGVAPTGDETNGSSYLGNLQVTRAYADVYTPVGRLRFGRMPMHWGAGILYNAGNDVLNEYGDSADRVQFTTRAGPVYVMAGYDVLYSGYTEAFEGGHDDMQAVDVAVAYRSEALSVGLYNRYRFQPKYDFRAYNGSLWGSAELGPVHAELEAVGVFGEGDLSDEVDNQRIRAAGGLLTADAQFDKILAGLQAGVATGDGDDSDNTLNTFTFDRDHNIALMMFEEPLPVLAPAVLNDANGGRDTTTVVTGDGFSNGFFLAPRIGYALRPDLSADVTYVAARALQSPSWTDEKGYGQEVDLGITYRPFEHFSAVGTFGVFFPGPYYSEFEDDTLGGDFDSATVGGRLMLNAEF